MRNHTLTENDFDLIIILKKTNPEIKTKQIADIVKFDSTTIRKVIRFGTWKAYCENKRQNAEKARAAKENKAPETTKEESKTEQQKTMIISFDQMKALAKDVDSIKGNIELLVQIGTQLLEVWKGC